MTHQPRRLAPVGWSQRLAAAPESLRRLDAGWWNSPAKTIGPWCIRAEICKNQAVHNVNRLCSIIILYTVYVYIYIQQIHLDPVLVKYTEGTIILEFWCLWLWGAKKTKGFSGFPITFQWISSSSNCFNYDQAQQTYRNSVSILNRVAATYSEIMWNLNKRALFRPWRWRTGNP